MLFTRIGKKEPGLWPVLKDQWFCGMKRLGERAAFVSTVKGS